MGYYEYVSTGNNDNNGFVMIKFVLLAIGTEIISVYIMVYIKNKVLLKTENMLFDYFDLLGLGLKGF